MRYSHVYFILQCQIQNFDYDSAEGSHEFLFRSLLFYSFFMNSEKSSIYRQLLYKNIDIINSIK